MGELGAKYYVNPNFIRVVVDKLKSVGANPFLFDTTVAYRCLRYLKIGYRLLARAHGFSKIGCKVKIGNAGKTVIVNNKAFDVANELIASSNIVVISHVTAHGQAGFGAAIKNLGMGGVNRKTKKRIHAGSRPLFIKDKCIFCGLCEKSCRFKAISVANKTWNIDESCCRGCGQCIDVCPNDALIAKDIELQKALALSTKAVTQHKNVVYINVLKNITPECDCCPSHSEPVCSDIGYLISDDPIAIDKASIDLVNKKMESDNFFKKLTGADPMIQIDYGEKINLGTTKYSLVMI